MNGKPLAERIANWKKPRDMLFNALYERVFDANNP